MKRRYISLICIIAFVLSMSGVNVRAQDTMSMVDGSYLTHEEEATGSAILIMRGEYLQAGTSKVSKGGTGIINAGGITSAHRVVNEVGVAVMVERLRAGSSSWSYYRSWEVVKTNASSASSSKRLTVPGGYYYRVRCTHWANSDASSSSTNGIYID